MKEKQTRRGAPNKEVKKVQVKLGVIATRLEYATEVLPIAVKLINEGEYVSIKKIPKKKAAQMDREYELAGLVGRKIK